MEKIGSYDVYRSSSYYDKTAQVKKDTETAYAAKSKETNAAQSQVTFLHSDQSI